MLADVEVSDISQRYRMNGVHGSGAQATVYAGLEVELSEAKRQLTKLQAKLNAVSTLYTEAAQREAVLRIQLEQAGGDDLLRALEATGLFGVKPSRVVESEGVPSRVVESEGVPGNTTGYTEGELEVALRNYEAFHRIPIGSATVEQLQSSSAKIDGWLRAGPNFLEVELAKRQLTKLQAKLNAVSTLYTEAAQREAVLRIQLEQAGLGDLLRALYPD